MPRNLVLLAAIVTVLAAGVAHAAPPAERPLFERFKASESKSHRERIRILNDAERCIQAARDHQAYRACERQEASARQALRQEVVKERQALRAELEARRAARPGAQL